MKYISYLLSFLFMFIAALSYAFWDQTELGKSNPFTAQYTMSCLFYCIGWVIFYSAQGQFKVGILNWISSFILFISLFMASQDIEDYLSETANDLNLTFLFLISVSLLIFIYSFKKSAANGKNI